MVVVMVVVSEVAADAFIWIEAHFLITNEMKEKEKKCLLSLACFLPTTGGGGGSGGCLA